MAGTRHVRQRLVVSRPTIHVLDQKGNRRTQGQPVLDARYDLHAVDFLPWRGQGALPRSAPIQLHLEVFLAQSQLGGTAIHDPADEWPVRFPERRQRENFAMRVGHALHPASVRDRHAPLYATTNEQRIAFASGQFNFGFSAAILELYSHWTR